MAARKGVLRMSDGRRLVRTSRLISAVVPISTTPDGIAGSTTHSGQFLKDAIARGTLPRASIVDANP
ncbi:hypothetical protein RHECNPAF_12210021 [Rhizobium etli CNPAF512]|nr:hypothetical protein RHECNPAF_12210021 [Rhizobium etli CNPAF512]